MKFLKSLLMGTGGVVLAGLVLALLAPKAAHAVVATAVQVVNTSANPAITQDASLQASQIVTITCQVQTSETASCRQVLPNGQTGTPGPSGGYVVPTNQYFVLKSMDTEIVITGQGGITIFLIDSTQHDEHSVESVLSTANGQISFGSGTVAGPGIEVVPAPAGVIAGHVTLHGYLTSN
jgi:hypothetical protein